MSEYIFNPKTNDSQVLGCVPLHGPCPFACADCFAQYKDKRGRSYLGENWEHTPNMPSLEQAEKKIIRVNDIGDSSDRVNQVVAAVQCYKHRFYNTSFTGRLQHFDAPFMLSVNPGDLTDQSYQQILSRFHSNALAVRVRVNMWNVHVVQEVINHYTAVGIPVIMTFMAYHETPIPREYEQYYKDRQRTINNYYCITQEGWDKVLAQLQLNELTLTCGRDATTHACTACRNCEKLYVLHMLRRDHNIKPADAAELFDLLKSEQQDEVYAKWLNPSKNLYT